MARKGSGRKNAETDRISGLPDEVLTHILSFLCTKEAVQTCVLSKRWRNTWADMPVLEFELFNSTLDDPNGNRDEAARNSVARFERFVDGVLDNLERTNLDTVRYARFVDDGEPPSMEWLDHVALLMPRLIHICINIVPSFDLPDLVFSCPSLQHLNMFLYTGAKTIIAPASINLPSLKSLDLRGVALYDDFAQKLFEGCPSIESIELVSCDLYFSYISSDVLKKLTIIMCRQFENMQISCPSVVSLSIDILHQMGGIQLKNMSSLGNANFQLCMRGGYFGDNMPVLNLFGGLTNTTSLKISLSYPESKELKKQLEKDVPNCRGFINLKKLSIGTWNMSCDFYLVACLLKHSPNLKELTLYPEDFYWNRDNTQVEPREVIIGGVPYRHEYLETVRIFDGGSHKLSQRLMKTLIKTLRRYVNKIGNIVIFSFWSISDNAYQEWYLSDTD